MITFTVYRCSLSHHITLLCPLTLWVHCTPLRSVGSVLCFWTPFDSSEVCLVRVLALSLLSSPFFSICLTYYLQGKHTHTWFRCVRVHEDMLPYPSICWTDATEGNPCLQSRLFCQWRWWGFPHGVPLNQGFQSFFFLTHLFIHGTPDLC